MIKLWCCDLGEWVKERKKVFVYESVWMNESKNRGICRVFFRAKESWSEVGKKCKKSIMDSKWPKGPFPELPQHYATISSVEFPFMMSYKSTNMAHVSCTNCIESYNFICSVSWCKLYLYLLHWDLCMFCNDLYKMVWTRILMVRLLLLWRLQYV